jgi:antitoxin component YwqK of YwqJK toxin-antitoxin module
MKRILAPILLLTLLFPALAFGETIDDLVITNGLYYKKYTVVPFTGNITGKSHGSFRNGKKHGPWVVYYKNGQLLSKGTLKDGKMDGPWVGYNDDGTVWEKYTGTF